MKMIILLLLSNCCKAQTYTNKQLSDKIKVVEATLLTQSKLNAKLIADTTAKSKRISVLEKGLSAFKSKIDSMTLVPDTISDFMIKGKSFRLRR